MGDEIDYNINNYSDDDLMTLFSLTDENITQNAIFDVTGYYINKSQSEQNENMALFFKEAQNKLLLYLETMNEAPSDTSSSSDEEDDDLVDDYTDNVISNIDYDDPNFATFVQPNTLNPKNKTEQEKITDRVNNADTIGIDKHFVMKRKHLGVSDVYDVPVTQGILNPNLKNKISRIINIDSQYRQNITNTASGLSTDFTIDLSEPINDVIHLRLFSLQVPYTWYLIDEDYGTDFFYVDNTKISITNGNYTLTELIEEINLQLTDYDISASLHPRSGKTTFNINGVNTITFYNKDIQSPANIDNNLGYIIGFRETTYTNTNQIWSITSESVGDTYGTKYFLLHIDDFNANQMNSNVIGASDNTETRLADPMYFARDSEFVKTGPGSRDIFIIPREKKDLTLAQLHTLNEINQNRTVETLRNKPPTMKNMFAMIPIRKAEFMGPAFCENGGSLQSNERTYFGPVNIQRLHVKLLDDKGNTVNLNGCNFSFSLVCETLYQY
jgi:hypothetical protein